MTDYVESGIRLIGDTDDASSKMEDLISLADDIDNLAPTLTVDTEVDSEGLDELTDLEDTTVTTTVDPEVTEEGKSLLTTLHELGVNPMEIIMNIGGTILDLVGKLNEFAVQPLLDIDTAVARINAQTGNAIPNAQELLNSLYPQDIGDIDAIASALIHAQQLGLPLEEATKAALEFVKVFPDNNPNDVMDALDQMVKNKLAPDITAAADLLTTAQQNGINKGNDLISVFERSSTAIKNLGLTGDEFLALAEADLAGGGASAQTFLDTLTKIKTGLQSGNKNSTDALAILGIEDPATTGQGYTDDFFKSVATAISNYKGTDAEKQALFQALVGGKLGQKDYEGFLNIASAQPSLDALTNATSIAATEMDDSLSGAIDDFVLAAQTAAMDFLSSDQIDLPGKIALLKTGLQDALNVLQNGGSLGDALTIGLKPIGWDDEFQKLESMFGNFIIELLGVIASIQDLTGHGDAAAATRETQKGLAKNQLSFDLQIANEDEVGQTVATAVSRGLSESDIKEQMADAVDALISNGDLQQAQTLIDGLKQGGEIRFNVTDPVVKKLLEDQGFDTGGIVLPITPDMSAEDIQAAVDGTIKQFGDEGITLDATVVPTIEQKDIDALQKELDTTRENSNKAFGAFQTGVGFTGAGQGGATPIDMEKLKTDTDAASTAVKEHATATDTLKTSTDTLKTSTEATTTATTAQSTETTALATQLGLANLATGDFTTGLYDTLAAYEENTAGLNEQEKAMYISIVQTQALSDATHDFSVNAAEAVRIMRDAASAASTSKSDASTTTVGKKASGGSFRGMSWVGEQGPELIGSGQTLSVLNNRTSRALMQALSGMPFMHYGGAGGGKNVSVTVNNNVQNLAQANAISYDIGQQVRGF